MHELFQDKIVVHSKIVFFLRLYILFNLIWNYSHFWLFLSVIGYSQVGIITERNFLVQWRRQDLARGGAQNDIEIT